jgi:hypothetical protein
MALHDEVATTAKAATKDKYPEADLIKPSFMLNMRRTPLQAQAN